VTSPKQPSTFTWIPRWVIDPRTPVRSFSPITRFVISPGLACTDTFGPAVADSPADGPAIVIPTFGPNDAVDPNVIPLVTSTSQPICTPCSITPARTAADPSPKIRPVTFADTNASRDSHDPDNGATASTRRSDATTDTDQPSSVRTVADCGSNSVTAAPPDPAPANNTAPATAPTTPTRLATDINDHSP